MATQLEQMKNSDSYLLYESSNGCGCGCAYNYTYFLKINNISPNGINFIEYKFKANIINNNEFTYENVNPITNEIKIMSMYEFVCDSEIDTDFCNQNLNYYLSNFADPNNPYDVNETINFNRNFMFYSEHIKKCMNQLEKYFYHSEINEHDSKAICDHINKININSPNYFDPHHGNLVTEIVHIVNILKQYEHCEIIKNILNILDECFVKNMKLDVFIVFNEIHNQIQSENYMDKKNDGIHM